MAGQFRATTEGPRSDIFPGTNTDSSHSSPKTVIRGTVYQDTNSNGQTAAGQPQVGVLVYLDQNGNGVQDDGEPTTLTDAGGGYAFRGPGAGTYAVRVDPTTAGRGTPAPAYAVTLDGSGFDLAEGKDFGLLPPSVVFGTVSGNQQVGGKVQPTATPRAGWAVGLLADRVAVAINAGEVRRGRVLRRRPDRHDDHPHRHQPGRRPGGRGGVPGRPAGDRRGRVQLRHPGAEPGGDLHRPAALRRVHVLRVQPAEVQRRPERLAGAHRLRHLRCHRRLVHRLHGGLRDDGRRPGRIVVAFTNGSAGTAQVNALQVFEPAGLLDTATTDAEGKYTLVGYGAGQYTFAQSPPPGWEQVAPEYSTPTFDPIPLTVKSQVPVPGRTPTGGRPPISTGTGGRTC